MKLLIAFLSFVVAVYAAALNNNSEERSWVSKFLYTEFKIEVI